MYGNWLGKGAAAVPRVKTMKLVITFPGTTQALRMEKEARERGLPGRLIPVPSAIRAGCGMAWSAPVELRSQLESLLEQTGIELEDIYELLL